MKLYGMWGNAITVCSMENTDPVGVHTGDGRGQVQPKHYLDKEYQMLGCF